MTTSPGLRAFRETRHSVGALSCQFGQETSLKVSSDSCQAHSASSPSPVMIQQAGQIAISLLLCHPCYILSSYGEPTYTLNHEEGFLVRRQVVWAGADTSSSGYISQSTLRTSAHSGGLRIN